MPEVPESETGQNRRPAWEDRPIPMWVAVVAVLLTVSVIGSLGLYLGNRFFWNPFDRRPSLEVSRERWETALKKNPADVEAHYELSWVYLQQSQLARARSEADRVLELQPEHVGARYNLALVARQEKDPELAEPLLKWITDRYPRHELALYALGLTYMDLKRYDDAVQALQKDLAVNPASADAHYQLGLSYRAQGDNTRADQEFHMALRYNPNLEAAAKALSER